LGDGFEDHWTMQVAPQAQTGRYLPICPTTLFVAVDAPDLILGNPQVALP
jgi:hypothetical protein